MPLSSDPEPRSGGFLAAATAFLKLALPMFVSRAGLATMGIVDAVMVSRFAGRELALLGLAEGTLGRFMDIMAAFLLGGLVVAARAFGSGRFADCGRVWRRTLPLALGIGTAGIALGLAGTPLLHLAGESDALARGGGFLTMILGLSIPAALLALATAVFLEAIGRPVVVAVAVVLANVLNFAFNWLLIGGHAGLPALGAAGSVLSTTFVRFLLAAVLIVYAVTMRDRFKFGIRRPAEAPGAGALIAGATGLGTAPASPSQALPWREQLTLGGSAAGVAAAMNVLAIWPTIFGGWLGAATLGAMTAAFTLNAIPMLMALGMADATSIQIAAARGSGSGDQRSLLWTNLTVAAVPLGLALVLFALVPGPLAALFSSDGATQARLAALVPLAGLIMVLDGVSLIVESALRGLGDAVGPIAIPVVFMIVMVPLAATLAFPAHLGASGLLIAIAMTSGGRVVALALRFNERAGLAVRTALRTAGGADGRRIA